MIKVTAKEIIIAQKQQITDLLFDLGHDVKYFGHPNEDDWSEAGMFEFPSGHRLYWAVGDRAGDNMTLRNPDGSVETAPYLYEELGSFLSNEGWDDYVDAGGEMNPRQLADWEDALRITQGYLFEEEFSPVIPPWAGRGEMPPEEFIKRRDEQQADAMREWFRSKEEGETLSFGEWVHQRQHKYPLVKAHKM